jgi:dihydrofolate synthase / folylpolyglutamate synthase
MFDLPKYGEGICLARMAELLKLLGVDRARLSRCSVVVTGSNGKGSTAAFCASIGRAFGLRTGLFTSPHLYRFNERFQINGAPISDSSMADLSARIEHAIAAISEERREHFGSFEAMFALACLYFQEQECEFAVFEAGIGGRYDPVRLVGTQQTCVTSVDYEHVELLGHSLELIVSDKSDACASPGTIIYGENCRPLRRHLAEYLSTRAITPLFVREEIGIAGESMSSLGQGFEIAFDGQEFKSLELALAGDFQFNNAAIAVALFLLWLKRARPGNAQEAIEAAVRSALRETRWPGRLEQIKQHPLTVIDVGHTPDGVRQSLSSLQRIYGTEEWVLVTGASQDKNAAEMVGALAPAFDVIIATAAQHKGASAEEIAQSARLAHPQADVHVAPTIKHAVEMGERIATSCRRKIYVAGGLFLAIEYATIARGGRPEELRFF